MNNPKNTACITLAFAIGTLVSLVGVAGCSASPDLASADLGTVWQAITGCGGACGLGYNCVNNQCTTSSNYYNAGAVYTAPPDLGPNVKVYMSSTPVTTINADLSAAYTITGQFSASRHDYMSGQTSVGVAQRRAIESTKKPDATSLPTATCPLGQVSPKAPPPGPPLAGSCVTVPVEIPKFCEIVSGAHSNPT